jgi:hypothetical protein
MKPKITTKQLMSALRLLNNLKEFEQKRLGKISNFVVMLHPMMANTILVKYEKDYVLAGEQAHDFKIASIDQDGKIDFIEEKFKDAFEQAAFLSVCRPFDIEDENDYEKID